MEIDNLELHDALIRSASIDYTARRISLVLEIYEGASEKQRTQVELTFDQVTSMSHVADFSRLEKNRFAGNINYWVAGEGQAATFIYLTDGVISIASDRPTCALKTA